MANPRLFSPAGPDPCPSPPPCDGAFPRSGCWTVVGLTGPAPWQAPQSARREDDGEERGHADREECPDEEEMPLRVLPKPTSVRHMIGLGFFCELNA